MKDHYYYPKRFDNIDDEVWGVCQHCGLAFKATVDKSDDGVITVVCRSCGKGTVCCSMCRRHDKRKCKKCYSRIFNKAINKDEEYINQLMRKDGNA